MKSEDPTSCSWPGCLCRGYESCGARVTEFPDERSRFFVTHQCVPLVERQKLPGRRQRKRAG